MLLQKLKQKTDYRETKILNVKNKDGKIFNHFNLNEGSERIAIIYGANASGKSYIARLIEESLRSEIPVRNVCMKNRASGSIESTLVFGREGKKSTGEASVAVMCKALESAKSDKGESLVILDEPNLGLSKRFSKALGQYLSTFVNENKNIHLLLVSHDDNFLKSFQNGLEEMPTTCGVNTKMNLQEWFDDEEVATMEELLNLPEKSGNQRRLIMRKEQEIEADNNSFSRFNW